MSYNYDEYLYDHIANVVNAHNWLIEHGIVDAIELKDHDKSKYSAEEYKAYDDYFYGNKSYKVVRDFNYAWLHHIHNNPHHWQYWVLQHDDEPEETLEMPYDYVVEMICDWWSFSWKSKNLYEIFDWYEKHKDMKLHEKTRKLVEKILESIREKLDEEGYGHLEHHGIKGQKWGVRNGPPYPIHGFDSPSQLSQHMKAFGYKEFDRLMSADDVGRTKSGSCHDQVMYELQQLRRMGKEPHGMFMMEYSDDNQGGMTHSLVYYNENGKTIWFENAWGGREGIWEFENVEDLKNEIIKAHNTGEYGEKNKYSNIIFGSFNDSEHEIGEDLQQLVNICLKDS